MNQIFRVVLPLCRFLQKAGIDLREAVTTTENTISNLEIICQNAETQFDTIFSEAQLGVRM